MKLTLPTLPKFPNLRKLPNLPNALRASPASRVALGLVGLMLAMLLLIDVFVGGFLPQRGDAERRHRLITAELIGTRVGQALQRNDPAALRTLLGASTRREPQLRSAAVLTDGELRAGIGPHAQQWRLGPDDASTLDNLRLPLFVDGRRSGELQLAFEPHTPRSLAGWLAEPVVLGMGLVAVLGFVAFQLYLRRAMRYLDPSAAVPERVRTAFDTLTEGVLVLDVKGRIMLANKAFLALGGPQATAPTGELATELAWLMRALPSGAGVPWQLATQRNEALLGIQMRVDADPTQRREVVANCSPINDGFKRARGCLVSFSDVTDLHERTERLREAMAELHSSREEIRAKNEELTLLATRDALTGCLNRRALLQDSDRAIAAAAQSGAPLSCIMCDIDHFKSINDRFGHGGGDEVLKAVAKALGRGLRTGDLLGRYGGEEFCVILPDATLEQARVIAERLRADVEANAGSSVRHLADVKVTMSFGVEQCGAHAAQFAAIVDRADQALYHSKKNGRNRVTLATELPAATPEETTAAH